MFLNRWTLSKKLYFGFGIVIILLLIVLTNTYINYEKQANATIDNLRTYEIMRESQAILESLINMETGARGYVLAGKEDFLQPYYQGQADYDVHFARLRSMTEDNPEQQQKLMLLNAHFESWFEWETEYIIGGRKQINSGLMNIDDVAALIQTSRGKTEMENMRAVLRDITEEEQRLLDIRTENLRKAEKNMSLIITAGGISVILLAIVISILTAS